MQKLLKKSSLAEVAASYGISGERVRQLADPNGDISQQKLKMMQSSLRESELVRLFELDEKLHRIFTASKCLPDYKKLFESFTTEFPNPRSLKNYIQGWRDCGVPFPYHPKSVPGVAPILTKQMIKQRRQKGLQRLKAMEKKIKDAQWRKKRDEDISIRYHHGEDCELIAKKYGLSKASIPVIVSTHNQKNHTSSK